MPPQSFTFGQGPNSNSTSHAFSFTAATAIPSIEVADDDSLASSKTGEPEPTPSKSDWETDSDQDWHTSIQSPISTCQESQSANLGFSFSFQALNLNPRESQIPRQGAKMTPVQNTGLLSGGCTSKYADMFNATPEPTADGSFKRPAFGGRAPVQNTGLSPGQSTSTYADMFNATPEPTPTASFERRAVSGSPPPTHEHITVDTDPPSEDSDSDSDNVKTDAESDDDPLLYNVRQELLPRARIYNADLQSVLSEVNQQLSYLKEDMRQCPLSQERESSLHNLYEQTCALSQVECPETRIVGFIGNSGVGKSQLINSLLDQPGLARSSGDGVACTSVVTEFRNADASHPNRTIEVLYMSTDEVNELLEALLQSFRLYYTDTVFREEVGDIQEQEQIREKATRAWSTFNSMFRERQELTREFLSDTSEGALPRILGELRRWAEASYSRRPGGTALNHTVTLASRQECCDHLDMLTMDSKNERGTAVWPFIKLIRVYLRSPILRTGLVLADLPGFRDLNFARVRATERYLKHSCNEVFVITTILRCVTDQSIEEIKRHCNKDQPLRIVCTRSEDVKAAEYSRDNSALAPQIGRLEDRVTQLNKRLAKMYSRWSSNTGVPRNEDAMGLAAKVEDAKFELRRFLVESRNEQVTTQLRKHGAEVRIFCVSNDLYSKNPAIGHADDYIGLSGIRELRRYCQLVPAEAQFRFVSGLLKHRVPALLRSIKQWTLAGSDDITAERAAMLREILLRVEKTFRDGLILGNADVRMFQTRLENQFNELVLDLSHERALLWKESALQASREWEGWAHGSYGAFCRKYGTHETEAVGYHCWNEELLKDMQDDLEEPWKTVQNWIFGQKHELRRAVKRLFGENHAQLTDNMDLAPIALGNFIDNMNARYANIAGLISQSLDRLLEGLRKIQLDALSGYPSSYIADLMLPVYYQCISDSGRGVDARRKACMRNYLTESNIFSTIINRMDTNCRSLFRENQEELRRRVNEEMENIRSDLRVIIVEEGEMSEAARFPEVGRVLKGQVEVAGGILERAGGIACRLRNDLGY